MNEMQRQHYLSALGIENYMPRLQLPFAPHSIGLAISHTELSEVFVEDVTEESALTESSVATDTNYSRTHDAAKPIGHLLDNIFDSPKTVRNIKVLSDTPAAPVQPNPDISVVEPFQLSVWRPLDYLMIIDSRNTKLALPTEFFLKSILNYFFVSQDLIMHEEILNWPTIENRFTQRTVADARNELQTWLSVQCEIRAIKHIWLMGHNSTTYLLQNNGSYEELLFSSVSLSGESAALVLPSLNDILQEPLQKQKLFSTVSRYMI